MEEGMKYSKNIVERLEMLEKEFNIDDLNISVFKGYTSDGYYSIDIIGEVIGECIDSDLIVAITVCNENEEIIGVNFSENINADSFEGIHTFSQSVEVASGEEISKVRVYLLKDPSAIW